MALSSGTRLGAYEITHVLGAGGMGEVYRARDTRLGRGVAIKIILEQVGLEGDRVARFEREAKVLAAINHPNIAALYGLEEADGRHFLVMELVEGETLAERIQRGALPVEDALRIALQIVEALEAAHEKGIVHRDLKPANIKITPDDKVKVLDFGLAKAMEAEASGNVANSPTLSMMATNAGVILGTAAYMSPEQAKGFAADHRSDVFSFGVVCYEMLTGRQPFQGETAPDILASVLVREPELHRLPPDLNPRLPELLRRCLEKHPKRRWQAIGDVRAELETIASAPRAVAAAAPAARVKPLWKRALPVAAVGIVTAALGGAVAWVVRPSIQPEITRFEAVLPDGQRFTGVTRQTVAVSRDGRQLVYVANQQLYLRPLSSLAAKPIQGTEIQGSVVNPVFSPDGQSVAFISDGDRTLKRIAITGGAAVTICPITAVPLHMSWTDNAIFFTSPDSIMRVSANGGIPEKLVQVRDEAVQRVQQLPGGDAILFTVTSSAMATGDRPWSVARVVAQSLKSGDRKVLVEGASDGWYVPTGHLLYMMGGTLHASQFDVRTLTVTGGAVPVVEGVRRAPLGISGIGWFDVSDTGTLVYVPGPATLTSAQLDVVLLDRKGTVTPLKLPPRPYDQPRISPDGKRVAVGMDDGRDVAIFTYEISGKQALQRVTFGGKNRLPVWTPDSKRLVFQSDRGGDLGLYWQAVDGTSPAERLTRAAAGEAHQPESWHPNGDVLLFSIVKNGEQSLWMYFSRDKKTAPFGDVRSSAPIDAVFHPDGRWVAYTSGTTLATTVFVQPFPATGALYEIVRTGTDQPHHPLWSPDGRELFVNPRPASLDAVSVTTRPTFAFGTRTQFPKPFSNAPPAVRRPFDMARDGRLVGLIAPGEATSQALRQVNVVLNWFEELKARVPAR